MNIPQIQIRQTFAHIGIHYKNATFQIQAPPVQLQITANPAKLQLYKVPGRLSIDQTQAFSDEGLRPPLAETQHYVAQAKQQAENAVASTAAWGHKFINSPHHPSISAWLSRYHTLKSFRATLIPAPFSVRIHYTQSQLKSKVQLGTAKVTANVSPVRIISQTGAAQVYVAQQNSLHLSVSGNRASFQA